MNRLLQYQSIRRAEYLPRVFNTSAFIRHNSGDSGNQRKPEALEADEVARKIDISDPTENVSPTRRTPTNSNFPGANQGASRRQGPRTRREPLVFSEIVPLKRAQQNPILNNSARSGESSGSNDATVNSSQSASAGNIRRPSNGEASSDSNASNASGMRGNALRGRMVVRSGAARGGMVTRAQDTQRRPTAFREGPGSRVAGTGPGTRGDSGIRGARGARGGLGGRGGRFGRGGRAPRGAPTSGRFARGSGPEEAKPRNTIVYNELGDIESGGADAVKSKDSAVYAIINDYEWASLDFSLISTGAFTDIKNMVYNSDQFKGISRETFESALQNLASNPETEYKYHELTNYRGSKEVDVIVRLVSDVLEEVQTNRSGRDDKRGEPSRVQKLAEREKEYLFDQIDWFLLHGKYESIEDRFKRLYLKAEEEKAKDKLKDSAIKSIEQGEVLPTLREYSSEAERLDWVMEFVKKAPPMITRNEAREDLVSDFPSTVRVPYEDIVKSGRYEEEKIAPDWALRPYEIYGNYDRYRQQIDKPYGVTLFRNGTMLPVMKAQISELIEKSVNGGKARN